MKKNAENLRRSYPISSMAREGKKCDDNVIQMNGLVMDPDNVPDLPECKEALKALPGARYIFRSPYNGIKVIIPFNQPVSDKNTYLILRECCSANIRDLTGIEPDKPSGWSQACFLSYDPNVIDLGAAHCLNVENTLLTHLQTEDNTTLQSKRETPFFRRDHSIFHFRRQISGSEKD